MIPEQRDDQARLNIHFSLGIVRKRHENPRTIPEKREVILCPPDDSIIEISFLGIVCEVRTQDPENFDEEVKSLLTACYDLLHLCSQALGFHLPTEDEFSFSFS